MCMQENFGLGMKLVHIAQDLTIYGMSVYIIFGYLSVVC